MAQTLAQANLLTLPTLRRGVISSFIQRSVVLDRLRYEDIQGSAYNYDTEATLPGVAFRAVNSAYTESTGTVSQSTESLVILGGDADVDKFIQQTRSNLNDQRAVQTAMLTKALSFKYQDAFINGDTSVDANSFDGLKKRLTGSNVIVAGTNGIPIIGNGGTDIDAFLDVIDAAVARVNLGVPGTASAQNVVGFMNTSILTKFGGALRRKLIFQTTQDTYGKPALMYGGVPFFDIGNNPAGTAILPQTETVGTSSLTASIYIVRLAEAEGDGGVLGLQNGGINVRNIGELETKPVYRTRVEWYQGLALFGIAPAVRITGVLNA